jgi:hypothetical protein
MTTISFQEAIKRTVEIGSSSAPKSTAIARLWKGRSQSSTVSALRVIDEGITRATVGVYAIGIVVISRPLLDRT